jgi:hypothetical protein
MKTWNVFIDTSIFRSSNFSINSKLFSIIESFCKSGRVELVLTDITIEEIKANLWKVISEAESAIKQARAKASILRNLDSDNYKFLFEQFKKEEIFNQLKDDIMAYFDRCDVEIIKATEVHPKTIFSDYFQGRPPFGEGKKKNEFPDAFIIAALNNWSKSTENDIYVVSGDQDFKDVSIINNSLIYLPSLQRFIELVLSDDNVLIEFIHNLINRNRNKIFDAIADEVKQYEMVVMDADPDAEAFIEEATIIDLYNMSVIELSENDATVQADASASLSIHVNCYDPDSWYKDSEDGTIYYWDKIEDIFEREMDFEVEFDIRFNKTDIDDIEILRVVVNKGELLEFYLDEDAQSFYK